LTHKAAKLITRWIIGFEGVLFTILGVLFTVAMWRLILNPLNTPVILAIIVLVAGVFCAFLGVAMCFRAIKSWEDRPVNADMDINDSPLVWKPDVISRRSSRREQ